MPAPLFPKPLRKGDRVAVLSPASRLKNSRALEVGLARLRDLGLEPHVMPHALAGLDYPDEDGFAGSDDDRLADLQAAINDPQLRAILCVRGGYGCTRLLSRIDWKPCQEDPKPLLGYSDVTALLAAAWHEIGLVGFHGPMVATGASHAMEAACENLQRQLLFEAETPELPDVQVAHTLRKGRASGRLVGGNLTLVCALIGTAWQIDAKERLLFLEDIGEAPYRVDRMLTQLIDSGTLRACAGVVLGDFHLVKTPLCHEAPEILRVFRDRLAGLDCPVAYGFPFGHRPRSWTLPFGAKAELDAADEATPARLKLLEAATR